MDISILRGLLRDYRLSDQDDEFVIRNPGLRDAYVRLKKVVSGNIFKLGEFDSQDPDISRLLGELSISITNCLSREVPVDDVSPQLESLLHPLGFEIRPNGIFRDGLVRQAHEIEEICMLANQEPVPSGVDTVLDSVLSKAIQKYVGDLRDSRSRDELIKLLVQRPWLRAMDYHATANIGACEFLVRAGVLYRINTNNFTTTFEGADNDFDSFPKDVKKSDGRIYPPIFHRARYALTLSHRLSGHDAAYFVGKAYGDTRRLSPVKP